jgi:hypothetical protein
MSPLKNFLRFFMTNGKNMEDIKPLTDYLKNNNHFRNTAHKIHHTKEGIKYKFTQHLDNLLEEEDGVKMIEDQRDKNKKV